jgi:hypothetical protein
VHIRDKLYEVLVEGVLITEAKIGGKRKQSEQGGQEIKMARRDQSRTEDNPRTPANSDRGRGQRGRTGARGFSASRGHQDRGGRGWRRRFLSLL